MKKLQNLLQKSHFKPVIQTNKIYEKLDFSSKNLDLVNMQFENVVQFSDYVFQEMLLKNHKIGIGGYGEKRVIYLKLKHFSGGEANARDLHLGTDIWTDAGTPIYAPLKGHIHSFAFNNHQGDYGPTIILRHQIENIPFFTLYGHLSLSTLEGLRINQVFEAGQILGTLGNFPENGNWPPHLHFQIIAEMGNYDGDYPGVCHEKDSAYFFQNCPNPNFILKIAENNP